MIYIFSLILLGYFAFSIFLVRSKLLGQVLPESSFYSAASFGYSINSMVLFFLSIVTSFFTGVLDWWIEMVMIVSITPISGFVGTYLARSEYKYRNKKDIGFNGLNSNTSVTSEITKGGDVEKMAEVFRNQTSDKSKNFTDGEVPRKTQVGKKLSPEIEKSFNKIADFYENIPVPKLKDPSHKDTYKLMVSAVELGYRDVKTFVSTFENEYRAESVIKDLRAFQNNEIDVDTLFENHTFLKLAVQIDKKVQWSDYIQDLLVCEISVRVLIDDADPEDEYGKLYQRIDELVEMDFFVENKMIDTAKRITQNPEKFLKVQRLFRQLNT